uniref:roadblock/LC7 domain-containing protein n=1 Tax=Nocardia abscessus TaxID=120957 RepID=UPI00245705DF
MATPVTDSSNKLGWLLEDLSITGVRFAVLLSDDGLRIAHSTGIARDEAERFAAAAARLRSRGKALGGLCGDSAHGGRQDITEYDQGMIL